MKKINECLACGSTDIQIFNCGYSSFNVAGGKCRKCNRECSGDLSWSASDDQCISLWNRCNNPNTELEKLIKERAFLNHRISSMRRKCKKFNKQNKP